MLFVFVLAHSVLVSKDGWYRAWQFEALSTVEGTKLSGCWTAVGGLSSELQLLERQCDEKPTDL